MDANTTTLATWSSQRGKDNVHLTVSICASGYTSYELDGGFIHRSISRADGPVFEQADALVKQGFGRRTLTGRAFKLTYKLGE